jgi:hypothetical protein
MDFPNINHSKSFIVSFRILQVPSLILLGSATNRLHPLSASHIGIGLLNRHLEINISHSPLEVPPQ